MKVWRAPGGGWSGPAAAAPSSANRQSLSYFLGGEILIKQNDKIMKDVVSTYIIYLKAP